MCGLNVYKLQLEKGAVELGQNQDGLDAARLRQALPELTAGDNGGITSLHDVDHHHCAVGLPQRSHISVDELEPDAFGSCGLAPHQRVLCCEKRTRRR